MHGVEADGVDRVDLLCVACVGWCLAVAFEGEVVRLVFFFNVLYCAAAFDAADGEAGCVGETGHDAGLPFQR